MRAALPVIDDVVERDGVRVHYEVYGAGDPTVFLLMPDTIVNSRAWKAQIPYLSRSFRVVAIDPRGNGRSDAPSDPEAYPMTEFVGDAWAVLDAVGADRAVLVGLCTGAGQAVVMAAERPERVLGVCAINPGMRLAPSHPHRVAFDFEAELDTEDGWAKSNRHYWLRDWPGFADFFFGQMFPEPHSTKQREDCVSWARQTTPETMLVADFADLGALGEHDAAAAACGAVKCPVLVVVGSLDQCQSPERGRRVAELTGGDLVVLEGSGHLPQARDPVRVNLLLRDFVRRCSR